MAEYKKNPRLVSTSTREQGNEIIVDQEEINFKILKTGIMIRRWMIKHGFSIAKLYPRKKSDDGNNKLDKKFEKRKERYSKLYEAVAFKRSTGYSTSHQL